MRYNAKFASFLTIPLKYNCEFDEVAKELTPCPLTTMDLTENVKSMLNSDSETSIGKCFKISLENLKTTFKGESNAPLYIKTDNALLPFDFCDSFLYVFKTKIAFLCLGVSYENMDVINTLTNTGHAESNRLIFLGNEETPIPFEQKLNDFCASFSLYKFFDGASSILLEAFTCTLAVLPKYFETLDELRRITFKLHQMIPLETVMDDESEEDTHYVYAVKSEEEAAYRWGYCVASQKLSYAVANKEMDFISELNDFSADGLPIAVLMLSQKYTCLRFTQLIAKRKNARELSNLKKMMLEFKAFATVSPANLSRWHNIKQIYAHLLFANDVPAAIEDISAKLSILTQQQDEIEARRTDRMSNIITVFGLVSILDSVLSIFSALREGDPILWHCSTLTASAVLVMLLLAARIKNR